MTYTGSPLNNVKVGREHEIARIHKARPQFPVLGVFLS